MRQLPRRLLDTDILIDIQRRLPAAIDWFRTIGPGEVGIPGFVAMELVKDARDAREARAADVIIQPLTVVWPSEEACRCALIDFRNLHLSHGVGMIDALIASTARAGGATLCTFNAKRYRPIEGLMIEQPYTRDA